MNDAYDILVIQFDVAACTEGANRRQIFDTRRVTEAQHITTLGEGQPSTDAIWNATRSGT